MVLDLSNREVGDVTVVDLEGRINTGTSPEADAHLSQLLAGGVAKLVLNFQQVDYISSSGLRVVLATGKKLIAAGGRLAMYGMNHSVHEVFRVSGFTSIFPVYDSETEAIESF